jgi:methyl-accepting chemotaxis protein
VREAGDVLSSISAQIVSVSSEVEMLASASHDQSTALVQINQTVNEMDKFTQQNASMAEEANAASELLASETADLMEVIKKFEFEGQALPDTNGNVVAFG